MKNDSRSDQAPKHRTYEVSRELVSAENEFAPAGYRRTNIERE